MNNSRVKNDRTPLEALIDKVLTHIAIAKQVDASAIRKICNVCEHLRRTRASDTMEEYEETKLMLLDQELREHGLPRIFRSMY
jgi:hypothetical protein